MRIVIDMQGAQTASRSYSAGRYSLSLADAIVRNRGEHEVLLVLNGMLGGTVEPIRAAFDGLLAQDDIRVWYAAGPVREDETGNTWRREAAELLREAFLSSLNPDVVLVTSLFEGYVDDAVTSIGRFTDAFPTAVVLYDLRPIANPDSGPEAAVSDEDHYWRKIGHIRRAQLLLSTSETLGRAAVDALHVSEDSVANILNAPAACFKHLEYTDGQRAAALSGMRIERPFVLYVGASKERADPIRLIAAFASVQMEPRDRHQLVIAGIADVSQRRVLHDAAAAAGLTESDLCVIGEMGDEQLCALYNLCRLFVFPPQQEGFALPVLEAMACGAPVIASNTPGLRELVMRDDALFDATDSQAMADKIAQVLADDDFRRDLCGYGLRRASQFSLDSSARRAIDAFEKLHRQHQMRRGLVAASGSRPRPRLAFVSPLPPERSGIADYSAELLPELARYYDIDVITPQPEVTSPWIRANCQVRAVDWFRANAARYDRVMYHFGNSPFHSHMFGLLEEIPGVVVLHDFFIGGVQWHDEAHGIRPHAWTRELQHAHGYAAFEARFRAPNMEDVVWNYPCNLSVIQRAFGVVVHSEASRELARNWYGSSLAKDWVVVPLLRSQRATDDRDGARLALGIPEDAFLVCSFGLLGPTKNNHRLLAAWLASPLSRDPRCRLVFVGENHGGGYGDELLSAIRASGSDGRVSITGWVSESVYRQYVGAADLAVQLRTLTRGETSAAVLDCMANGLPTIINAHGSMAEFPRDAVWMLQDDFTDAQLVDALVRLHDDVARREALGARARQHVRERHAPAACALRYRDAIEVFHATGGEQLSRLTQAVAKLDAPPVDTRSWMELSRHIAESLPGWKAPRLLLDISAVYWNDIRTGIQRVARSVTLELLRNPPAGYAVEPVFASDDGGRWKFRYARRYAARLLGCPEDALEDAIVEFGAGDVLLCPDLTGVTLLKVERAGLLQRIRDAGVRLHYLVFDLLPVLRPEFFPPGTDVEFARWLRAVGRVADGVIGISKAVSDEFADWLGREGLTRYRPLHIGWFHLGADIAASAPTSGHDASAESTLTQLRARASFLMVGTIEPRKGYLQAIAAFEALWTRGVDVNLVIVGKEGWKHLHDSQRRTIPQIVARLREHPELGKRLIWLEGISDDYLERVYAAATCLIAASEGEGFGLPLIEAAQHGLPIIARDIPVFREVAGTSAFYFSGREPSSLAAAVDEWLQLKAKNIAPCPSAMSWLRWKQSVQRLGHIVLKGDWTTSVMPGYSRLHTDLRHYPSDRLKWQNFGPSKEGVRWMKGSCARIGFDWPAGLPSKGDLLLEFDAPAMQSITVLHNGVEVFRGQFIGERLQLRCALSALVRGDNVIDLALAEVVLPGLSGSRSHPVIGVSSLCVDVGQCSSAGSPVASHALPEWRESSDPAGELLQA